MKRTHKVIIVPGLNGETDKITLATNHWRRHGLEPVVCSVGWQNGENNFRPKLKKLIDLVDKFSKNGETVSLVGLSAGGSAVLNLFFERKNNVRKVVNICGRLRTGPETGFRSFKARTKSSPAFAQSVKLFESREEKLTENDRKKIMTVRAMFGDELVPPETAIIKGAYNTAVPTPEHIFSIFMALTMFSKPVILFLNNIKR